MNVFRFLSELVGINAFGKNKLPLNVTFMVCEVTPEQSVPGVVAVSVTVNGALLKSK